MLKEGRRKRGKENVSLELRHACPFALRREVLLEAACALCFITFPFFLLHVAHLCAISSLYVGFCFRYPFLSLQEYSLDNLYV